MTHRYSSESAQREQSIGYQHERVQMVFKDLCIIVLWTKVATALEVLIFNDDVMLILICHGQVWKQCGDRANAEREG